MKAIKPKKLVLDNSMLEEEFFEDAHMIGIVSPLDSYRLVWNLNLVFNYTFIRNHECEIPFQDIFYEVYTFIEHDKLIEHYLYTNRKSTNYLLSEAKNIDFIWLIKSSYLPSFYTSELPQLVKSMRVVDYCFDIKADQLKSKHLLIL